MLEAPPPPPTKSGPLKACARGALGSAIATPRTSQAEQDQEPQEPVPAASATRHRTGRNGVHQWAHHPKECRAGMPQRALIPSPLKSTPNRYHNRNFPPPLSLKEA